MSTASMPIIKTLVPSDWLGFSAPHPGTSKTGTRVAAIARGKRVSEINILRSTFITNTLKLHMGELTAAYSFGDRQTPVVSLRCLMGTRRVR